MENTKEFTLLFQPPAVMQMANEAKDAFLKKTVSLYIHIPFCEKKCFFCSIVTCQKFSDDYIESYVKVLEKEIRHYQSHFQSNTIGSIHIGGGTPSLLNENQVERLFNTLRSCVPGFENIEVVFEAEASSLSDEKIDILAQGGQVAINLGVQTFDPVVIRKINRWSSPERIIDRLTRVGQKNFRSVGIDIMCNLPYSDISITLADIDKAKELNVHHVSLYPLRVEPDSVFHDYYPKYGDSFLDDTTQSRIYRDAAEYLRNKGYDHYSIFHFSNKAEETYLYSRNQMYGGQWIGMGVAAYSYFNNSVFANTRDLDEYISSGNDNFSRLWVQDENNTQKDIIRQFVFSLRITRISYDFYRQKYGEAIFKLMFRPLIRYLVKEELADEWENGFQLSDKGILNFPKIESDILENFEKIIADPAAQKFSMA